MESARTTLLPLFETIVASLKWVGRVAFTSFATTVAIIALGMLGVASTDLLTALHTRYALGLDDTATKKKSQ